MPYELDASAELANCATKAGGGLGGVGGADITGGNEGGSDERGHPVIRTASMASYPIAARALITRIAGRPVDYGDGSGLSQQIDQLDAGDEAVRGRRLKNIDECGEHRHLKAD
eukprot:7379400-Prymnesium_polylepis.1